MEFVADEVDSCWEDAFVRRRARARKRARVAIGRGARRCD